MRMVAAGDSSLLVGFGDSISQQNHLAVMSLFSRLQGLRDARIRNLHPAYASLLIDFDPLRMSHHELEDLILEMTASAQVAKSPVRREIEIPVCYEPEFGPDLANVARLLALSPEEVIALHETGEYSVHFLGFAPGFAYLAGLRLPKPVPRLASPRLLVPAGSVAVAGEQTAIYPFDSPGGWQLIGRTPVRMFDVSAPAPARLQLGDSVRFRRIDVAEFNRILSKRSTP
jgi:inhibitor of KinA